MLIGAYWQSDVVPVSALQVRDMVKVPSGLPPGDYVLGFRYDCEATAQVWNSCSDIKLVK